MKIAYRDLETARKDPQSFGRQLAAGVAGTAMSRGYFMDWRDAVLGWHSGDGEPFEIRNRLQAALERHFTGNSSEKKREETLDRFDRYVACFTGLGYRPQRTRMAVATTVDQAADIIVSGQVPVLARKGMEYVAILLISKETDWENELRSPLLQDAAERKLNLFPGDLSIGAYEYLSGTYAQKTFSEEEIESAKEELALVLDGVQLGLNG